MPEIGTLETSVALGNKTGYGMRQVAVAKLILNDELRIFWCAYIIQNKHQFHALLTIVAIYFYLSIPQPFTRGGREHGQFYSTKNLLTSF